MEGHMPHAKSNLNNNDTPLWARQAIWYQILVERFYNGNTNNDPTKETCEKATIDPIPESWTLTPWSHNWYKQEEWAQGTGLDFYRAVQMRRYGGDLDGVIEKIPYLVELGITAVYLNPVNDAPSLHKYDARYYHHIDVTFGDDITGDRDLILTENADDPNTWQWTSADLKFLKLVNLLHHHGIKIIMDFSWNHTGISFWAFQDIIKNKSQSKYKDWYNIHFNVDPDTGSETFKYAGWQGISSLPEWKKVETTEKRVGEPFDGNLDAHVKDHIFKSCKRWIDPYGDGSCRDGIDGMRLDVAEDVPVGFWREFRQFVKSLNPDFFLVGENWWSEWPHRLMDTTPWLQGDIFDSVMHYHWFKVVRGYFVQSVDGLSLSGLINSLEALIKKFPLQTQQALMNVAASHDTPRLLTSFHNKNVYKLRCKPSEDSSYFTGLPDTEVRRLARLLLFHQFTFIGAPHIWNGDEMGMVGADDPDNRKPLWWPDIIFDEETQSPYSNYTYSFVPRFNPECFEFYKSLIALRKQYDVLSLGDLNFIYKENFPILMYQRKYGDQVFLVLINVNSFEVSLPNEFAGNELIFRVGFNENPLKEVMPPLSGCILSV